MPRYLIQRHTEDINATFNKVVEWQRISNFSKEYWLIEDLLHGCTRFFKRYEPETIFISYLFSFPLFNLYLDRDTFASLVREVASPDVGRMGIEILSFTIKDIVDNVQYLDSLGKTQTANVKKEADIGVADANAEAGVKVKIDIVLIDLNQVRSLEDYFIK